MSGKKYSLSLVIVLSAPATLAAEVDYFSLTPAELAEIPVTIATGTAQVMHQSAAVISIITAEQIKNMGATELHEVLETVPGFHTGLQSSTYDYQYSVRGIRNATNSQLLIMLNGTRINLPFRGSLMSHTELPLAAVERIEIIRGPGSALYGADAFAGVINIITKKARDINGTQMGMRAGNANTQSGFAQHSDHWAGWDIASSIQYQHTDGDNNRIIHKDLQTTKDHAFGTHASLAPGKYNGRYETLDAHFNLQRPYWTVDFWSFSSFDSGTRAGVNNVLSPSSGGNGQQYLGDIRFSTEDLWKNWELNAHLSYLYADFAAAFQVYRNGAELPVLANGNIGNSLNPNLPRTLFPNGVNDRLGRIENIPALELGTIYKGLDKHLIRFMGGFRYEQLTTKEAKNFGAGVIDGSQSPTVISGRLTDVTNTLYAYLANTHRFVFSGVLQDEWQLAENWQLTTGLRYDHYSDFGNTLNPRIALIWDINRQLTTKLLYGRAFRAPSFSELGNQNNPVLLGNKNLKPETINTFEWAVDYRPFDTLRTALNLYYYDVNNLISPIPDIGKSSATFQNNGHQHGYGGEFEWHWQINDSWRFFGNYAWQHAENTQTNERVYYVPEQHLYSAIAWSFLPAWHLQPQLNWLGGRISPQNDNRDLSDYQTIDITLRGKKIVDSFNIAASVHNVLDARNNFEPASMSLPQNIPNTGRLFYFEISTQF